MILGLCMLLGVQGCSVFELIDDDLSVCGVDYKMALNLELQTSLDLELQTTLYAETDVYTRQVLQQYFQQIFTDHAHDIRIGFFSQENDSLIHSINEVIDANQSTYTFYLPKDNYYALALANIKNNGVIELQDTTYSRQAHLVVPSQADTLPTQHTGLFTVRKEITVLDSIDQQFQLTLHMVNASVALVIDTAGVATTGFRAYVKGTADNFAVRDSLYSFGTPRTITMEHITEQAAASAATTYKPYKPNKPYKSCEQSSADSVAQTIPYLLGCTCMPSADQADSDGTYFSVPVYVSLPDGTTTETILTVHQPLPAGSLKVIKTQLQPNGEVKPIGSPEVGASVTLDWKNGGEHNIEI